MKPTLWRWLRLARLAGLDAADAIAFRRRAMTPSRVANEAIGGGDFHRIGDELLSIVRELASLEPHERMVDIGCGYGRLAVPATAYLTTGEYAGFDIDRRAIRWCRREISARHPNFWFTHVDVANSHYNPRGAVAPEAFVFPCANASVDVAVATSLFTHLLPVAAARYASEIARVLQPGGRAVLTFFLFDQETKARLTDPLVLPQFGVFPEPFYAVSDPADPEIAVAYDLDVVRQAFAEMGLTIERVARGGWSVSPEPLTYQDVVLARRTLDSPA